MDSGKTPSSFGDRLSVAIDNAGIKQVHLAKELKVSPNTVSSWKRGRHHPHHQRLAELAQALGTEVAVLAGEKPERGAGAGRGSTSEEEISSRLAERDLLGALKVLQEAQPQLHRLADAIPDLVDLLSTASERGQDRPQA